jgi:hypothetical protein
MVFCIWCITKQKDPHEDDGRLVSTTVHLRSELGDPTPRIILSHESSPLQTSKKEVHHGDISLIETHCPISPNGMATSTTPPDLELECTFADIPRPVYQDDEPTYIDECGVAPEDQYNSAASVPFFNMCSATMGYPTARLIQYRLSGILSVQTASRKHKYVS